MTGAGWRLALTAATLTALAGCGDSPDRMPEVPAVLIKHDETPFGDRELSQITRSTRAALDLLEPHWGRIGTTPYTIDRKNVVQLRQQLERGAQGWERVNTAFPAERGELLLYSSGDRMFGLLVIPVSGAPESPVILLSNQG